MNVASFRLEYQKEVSKYTCRVLEKDFRNRSNYTKEFIFSNIKGSG
ncbi:hypothetical protein LEP1GSC172_0024 [Leptospira noguchii]|uniref:Uncharacterized protein n=1 Tax=Leptospira noguchii TaxID=28182 RepID=M6VGM2_9LEPT|nr:hypothetical protein LEP1GSC172_0024 [Leptospira noguchii]